MSQLVTLPHPDNPRVLPRVRLFAVMGTWMEADVVAATVRNAITQGCARVYLVDNGSPDDTVEVACREGAILARSFTTQYYDESLRLQHMNEVAREVSAAEPDAHLWWLFLDGDEFPHGPSGLTLLDYLRSIDERFRVVGTRYFNHYPGAAPHYVSGRHPLDYQPLCEELVLPMCPSGHRKHPLLRHDRNAAPIECGVGFHLVHCAEPLFEPAQPAFIHHFPFREEATTRSRLAALWTADASGSTRATQTRDTHMLARRMSLDEVYAQKWDRVVNFVSLDPMRDLLAEPPPPTGVALRPWSELVEPEHQHVLRWYSMLGAWNYDELDRFHYGDDITYVRGLAFLDGHGTIEDWGCGFAHARAFVTRSEYIGVDGSSRCADRIVDLREYSSDVDCIFMRHVLEHNTDWRRILANAVASFRKRMVLVVFTPLGDATRQIATTEHSGLTTIPVPDISFSRNDLTRHFQHLRYREESVSTSTQYGTEHIFYIEKPRPLVTRLRDVIGQLHARFASPGRATRSST